MFSFLRFLVMFVCGFLTVAFFVMTLISSFRHTRYGSPTKKTVQVSAMYLALCTISLTLFVIMLDPTKISAAMVLLAIGLSSVAFFVGASYFNLALVEKGPRKMFAPIWQFLKRLFSGRNSN